MAHLPATFRVKPRTSTGAWARKAAVEPVERIRGRAGVALRAAILAREPLCRMCDARGRVSASVQADHIVALAHGGTNDPSNFQGLCQGCHDEKSATERRGQALPGWLPAPAIPVTMVCGPPASGKSTYVAANAVRGDVVIDLDEIVHDLTGQHGHDAEYDPGPAIWERNRRLADLARAEQGRAWFIVSAATRRERDWWSAKLSAKVVMINPGEAVCLARAAQRPGKDHLSGVRSWFHRARADR